LYQVLYCTMYKRPTVCVKTVSRLLVCMILNPDAQKTDSPMFETTGWTEPTDPYVRSTHMLWYQCLPDGRGVAGENHLRDPTRQGCGCDVSVGQTWQLEMTGNDSRIRYSDSAESQRSYSEERNGGH